MNEPDEAVSLVDETERCRGVMMGNGEILMDLYMYAGQPVEEAPIKAEVYHETGGNKKRQAGKGQYYHPDYTLNHSTIDAIYYEILNMCCTHLRASLMITNICDFNIIWLYYY